MQFAEFCRQTGLSLSPSWEALYRQAQESGELTRVPCTDRLTDFYPTLHNTVAQAAAHIAADPTALRYYNLLRTRYFHTVEALFLPPREGDVMRNFAPTLALTALWENTEKELQRRGVDAATCNRLRHKVEMFLLNHHKHFGYYATAESLFFWATHYLRPDLYPIGSLEFEVTVMADNEAVYRHRATGEAVWLLNPTQTDNAYIGSVYRRGGQECDPVTLPKDTYEPWIAPADDILSVHIPADTDISPAACAEAYRQAKAFFARHYPEKTFCAFYCRSWLMDPALADILPPSSRIASFQRFYQRYPYPSNGKEVFVFVHPAPFARYEELPETTSLERALKQRYLQDEPIYRYAGVHDMEGV